MSKVLVYAKAVVAAVVSVGTLVVAAAVDKNISFDEAGVIWAALLAALTGGAVAATRNRPSS